MTDVCGCATQRNPRPGAGVMLVCWVLLSCTTGAARSAQTGHCTAFVDVNVVPMDRNDVLPGQTVVVEDRWITQIAAVRQVKAPRNCRRIDGQGRFLMPGLIDSHVHLFGYSRSGADDIGAERTILRMLLLNGITAAVVMEGTPEVLRLRDAIRSGAMAGPRLYSTGPFIQMTGSGELPGRATFDTPEQVRQEVRREKAAGYDFVKVHGDLPQETYEALLADARQQGLRVVGHTPPNLPIDVALDGGQAMITHAESYLDSYFRFQRPLPTATPEIDAMAGTVARHTAAAGVWVQPTLSVFRQIAEEVVDPEARLQRAEVRYMPPEILRDWQPSANPYLKHWKLDDVPRLQFHYTILLHLVRALHDARVPLLAGTDDLVPMQVPGYAMRDELEEFTRAGLTPYEALQTATANPARFLEASDLGTLEKGKVANVVLVDANPLTDVDNAFLIAGVMLEGAWHTREDLRRDLVPASAGAH